MSTRIFAKLTMPRQLPVWYHYSSSSSRSSSGSSSRSSGGSSSSGSSTRSSSGSGSSKGSASAKDQNAGGSKPVKEPKKPFEQPKTSGASADSKQPPPPAKEPFDNSKYQVLELYQHNPMSFYDIECSLAPFRCPVPSSIKKPT